MQMLVATWTLRLSVVAALAVGGVSYQAGASALDCVDRALAAAVGFTLAGRWLLGWLEPPELRMLKMRQRRDARRSKKGNGEAGGSTGRGRQAAPTMSKSA